LFPIGDDNPRVHPPYATCALIALNAAAWLLVQGLGQEQALARSLCLYGLVPGDLLGLVEPGTTQPLGERLACRFDGEGNPLTLVASMFLHGSWLHIIGNLWFLWIFGDNVEDRLGPLRFIVFYLLCGLAAAGAQIASDPASTIPMVGASGAIGGVMGAYALLFPQVRVNLLIFLGFYVTTVQVPALLMLGYWFLLQILGGIPALGSGEGGVAFWAHVGGFVAGLVLALPLRLPRRHRRLPRAGRRGRGRDDDGRWF
jgi:membrane associated rhomboid family serine protease